MSASLVGKLLVSNPLMGDPNFYRTVVLMVEHDDEGSMGLVLNRPSEEPVAIHVPMWADTVVDPDVVFFGGPVMTDIAIGIGRGPVIPNDEWAPIVGDVSMIDVAFGPDHWGGMEAARIYAGYSGWISGQLEAELAIDSWLVCEAEPIDVFDSEPLTLWHRVLERQPGRLSLYANFPHDLSSN